MIREIIKIDEELCNGCGDCVPNCHEGALQIIDGKARLVSELMCDGLGACLGHCPVGALTIEKREAEDYDEVMVIKEMIPHGKNTIIAHLKHLKDHGETKFLQQAVAYLSQNAASLPFSFDEVRQTVHSYRPEGQQNAGCQTPAATPKPAAHAHGGGCPGSRSMDFRLDAPAASAEAVGSVQSQLKQWPVQLHLVNPQASFFQKADLLVAADCVPFTLGNFHQDWLKGKALAIACPKLDHGQEIYLNKLISMIDQAGINTITVMIMEVPCCGGLLGLVRQAAAQAKRKVPVKAVIVGVKGDIIDEHWV